MATRREFLGGAGALLAAGLIPAHAATTPVRLMSAAHIGDSDGGALWRADGALEPFALPARGHALARLGQAKVVVMGRRPGMFGAIVDADDPTAPAAIFTPAKGNRFAGHAATDGATLITSEFDAETVQAALVARDPLTGAERAQWTLDGIEPHELIFTDGRLVVALGGLIKDGGVAGPAINPGGIESAVLEIDPKTGAVRARHALETKFASLSLRHLAVGKDMIAVAAQDQDLSETRPLLSLLTDRLVMLPMPPVHEADFRGYVGSVAFDASGEFVAAASPRGSVLGFWSAKRGAWLAALPIADACGVAAAPESGAFWVSSGHGGLYKVRVDAAGPRIEAEWHVAAGFDNHLILA